MTAVTPTATYDGWNNEIKTKIVKVSTPGTGYTYDTDMDASDARGAEFTEIMDAFIVDNTQKVQCTWSSSTGIVTVGTITTPVNPSYLHIVGK